MTARREDNRAWLPRGIARHAGVSLDGAIDEGRLSAAEFDGIVTLCHACQKAEDCTLWRLLPPGTPGRVPGYCLNGEIIERLSQIARAAGRES